MNTVSTFRKRLISIGLTILLGPGIGHLYLRKFKQAAILVLLALVFAFHQIWIILKSSGLTDYANLTNTELSRIINNFAMYHPKTLFYYDMIFAAIWAYALMDCFIKSKEGAEQQNEPVKPEEPEDDNKQA